MTLRELCETTANVCELDIDVREATDKSAKLIESWHIGSRATEDRVKDGDHEPRWKCCNKPINHKELGKPYWGFIAGNVPKKLLDMEVWCWRYFGDYTSNNGLNKHMILHVDLKGNDDCIVVEAAEESKGIEGQMSITDILGGISE